MQDLNYLVLPYFKFKLQLTLLKKLNEEVRYGIASTKLEQYRSGKGAEDTWLSGPNSPQNSWNMVYIEYPDIVKTL